MAKKLTKLVSVIMPAYNAERFIEESIKSVVNQTYCYWNLIIVNDGSIDKTKEIILKYVYKDPERIFLVNKEKNEGTSKALNSALDFAKGNYICWLSADDLYVSDMLYSSVDFLEKNLKYDAVFSKSECINEKSEYIREWSQPKFINEIMSGNLKSIYKEFLFGRYVFHGCSVLGTRDSFEKAGRFLDIYRYAHDYDYWFRFLSYSNFGFLNRTMVKAREYEQQISKQGHNHVDAIRVFGDNLNNIEVLQLLMEKAGFKYDIKNILKCFEARLNKYILWTEEYIELKKCFIEFFQKYCFDNNLSFKEHFEDCFFLKICRIKEENNIIIKNSFFEENNTENYLSRLCRFEKLDGFIINNNGVRFDKYKNNNDFKKVCMGFERYNEIVVCTISSNRLHDILEKYNSEVKFYITEGKKDIYQIGFSDYMLYDSHFKNIFDGLEIDITEKSIWKEVLQLLLYSIDV